MWEVSFVVRSTDCRMGLCRHKTCLAACCLCDWPWPRYSNRYISCAHLYRRGWGLNKSIYMKPLEQDNVWCFLSQSLSLLVCSTNWKVWFLVNFFIVESLTPFFSCHYFGSLVQFKNIYLGYCSSESLSLNWFHILFIKAPTEKYWSLVSTYGISECSRFGEFGHDEHIRASQHQENLEKNLYTPLLTSHSAILYCNLKGEIVG